MSAETKRRAPTAQGLRAAILDRWYAVAQDQYDLLSEQGIDALEQAIEEILIEADIARNVAL